MNISKNIILICILIIIEIFFTRNVIAVELERNFDKINFENITSEIPKEFLDKYDIRIFSPIYENIIRIREKKPNIKDQKYNLANYLNLRVDNQENTHECWAISALASLETNLALETKSKDLKNFSERHMDYCTSRNFKNGENTKGYNRDVTKGGLPIEALSYLTNGSGAVLEDNMSFQNSNEKINLDEINCNVNTIVTDYVTFPKIKKEYIKDDNGNTIYVKYFCNGKECTREEIKCIRNMIKEHLIKYGSIMTMSNSSDSRFYNNKENIFKSTNYNCNDSSVERNHAITIVGWDDNYSKENFTEGAKPLHNGAYIALNSYGDNNFDNGYIYISYEDFFVESDMYGIKSSNMVDYDNIYQHDFFGGIFEINNKDVKTGYYANTYKRDTMQNEEIISVGVSLVDYVKIEIYINPSGTDMNFDNLIKIGESKDILQPGYHRLEVNNTELNSNEFTVVIKQTSLNENFCVDIEAPVQQSDYKYVDSESRSFISLDGIKWNNLNELKDNNIDMTKADVCIKAFTRIL